MKKEAPLQPYLKVLIIES